MNRLKLVTFDVTNTLLKYRTSVGQEYAQTAHSYGVYVKKESLATSFRAQWKILNKLHPNFGVASGLSSVEWWNEIVKRTFQEAGCKDIKPKQLEAICSHLYKKYQTKDCYEIIPGVVDTLEYLQAASVMIGVISNFDERLPYILKDIGLWQYFKFVLPSYLVKHEKPGQEIFQLALHKANVTASDAVHIGDQVELDYLGAKNAGWNAFLIVQDKLKESQIEKVNKNDIISHITDLKHFIYNK